MAGIPIIGCGALASAICMDKDRAHRLASLAGVDVPKATVFTSMPDEAELARRAGEIGFPVFVKPGARRLELRHNQGLRRRRAHRRREVRLPVRPRGHYRGGHRRLRGRLRRHGQRGPDDRPRRRDRDLRRHLRLCREVQPQDREDTYARPASAPRPRSASRPPPRRFTAPSAAA